MKAIAINQYGSPDVLQWTEFPTPLPKPQELLIEIHACALNPIDFKLRSGAKKEIMSLQFPFIPGCDVSGVVKQMGSEVNNFKIGDEVYFACELTKGGGYAQQCVINQSLVALKSAVLDHTQAASLPIVGLTTIQALRDFAGIKSGDKVLIHAGAGGVGSFAIQYAKFMGAQVFTTASKDNHPYLYELGADVCIDYHTQDFLDVAVKAGKMDIVFETMGGLNYAKSILATKAGGAVPCIVNPPDADVLALSSQKDIKTDFVLVKGNTNDLDYITHLVDTCRIKPIVSSIINFDIEEIRTAHIMLELKHTKGKMVIKIN